MLLGGGGGCQGCGCKSCQECTRECTNPHTGTAFEVVYTYKFEGVEAGNPSDGYLDATGDADSSDPYDGMDGNGPWTQSVSANFNFLPSTTRFPCWVRVSFWRSQFLLGAATTPAPSQALDSQTITITNNGAGDIVIAGEFENAVVLAPGESYTGTGIPLVSGSGDQSTNRPRFYEGVVGFRPACGNDSVNVTVTAEISWSVKKRQHILYGIVLECYEEGTPCATFCDGTAPPNVVYLTLSNVVFSLPSGSQLPSWLNGATSSLAATYALDRVPHLCMVYSLTMRDQCGVFVIGPGGTYSFSNYFILDIWFRPPAGQAGTFSVGGSVTLDTSSGSQCAVVSLRIPEASRIDIDNCDLPLSGSNGTIHFNDGYGNFPQVGTFSWSIDD